jgi:hypothetical protein
MSSGFIFGGRPFRLTTPAMVPAVDGSTLIVAAFGEAAVGSEAGWDLLQPASESTAISAIEKYALTQLCQGMG